MIIAVFLEQTVAFLFAMVLGVLSPHEMIVREKGIQLETMQEYGFALGDFSFSPEQGADHEYGHIMQRDRYGLAYYLVVGIPSVLSFIGDQNHMDRWFEVEATRLGRGDGG